MRRPKSILTRGVWGVARKGAATTFVAPTAAPNGGWNTMGNRRHLYIPDDLWRRLQSEAGAAGVRERGRAYSASEYACEAIREKTGQAEEVQSIAATEARLERLQHRPGDAARMLREAFETCGAALGDTPVGRRLVAYSTMVGVGGRLQTVPPPGRPFVPVTKEQQTRRRKT
jgi:hypothetical protein